MEGGGGGIEGGGGGRERDGGMEGGGGGREGGGGGSPHYVSMILVQSTALCSTAEKYLLQNSALNYYPLIQKHSYCICPVYLYLAIDFSTCYY